MPLPTAAGEDESNIQQLEFMVTRFGLQQVLTWINTVCSRKVIWSSQAASGLDSNGVGLAGTATSGAVAWATAGSRVIANLTSYLVK